MTQILDVLWSDWRKCLKHIHDCDECTKKFTLFINEVITHDK